MGSTKRLWLDRSESIPKATANDYLPFIERLGLLRIDVPGKAVRKVIRSVGQPLPSSPM